MVNPESLRRLGNTIKAARERQGIPLSYLAHRARVRRDFLRSFEDGGAPMPRCDIFRVVAHLTFDREERKTVFILVKVVCSPRTEWNHTPTKKRKRVFPRKKMHGLRFFGRKY
jgi:transcriptional regulator with XRE-family HTH domain